MVEKKLFVNKFLMELLKGDRGITGIDGLDNGGVRVIETEKDTINEIFMIHRFAKGSKLVSAGLDGVQKFSNGGVTFGCAVELVFKLFDVATARKRIGFSKCFPQCVRGGGARD